MSQIELRVDEARIMDVLTVGHLIAVSDVMSAFHSIRENGIQNFAVLASFSKNVRVLRDFVAQFVWNGEGYMDLDEARPLVEQMGVKQLFESVQGITAGVEDIAIPKA